ncbi:hypothetical protein DFH08DRAFT_808882 [Mycena albidolilacea]|uniref:Uncharacterized protein n=1 Tax=Mycena albidolilacea TaxID=1033008 RepID=A0AAD7A2A0_9AGAR|nr:hypothetical protein DFH08DRAFT_808882 [Mycena albidolilacea]
MFLKLVCAVKMYPVHPECLGEPSAAIPCSSADSADLGSTELSRGASDAAWAEEGPECMTPGFFCLNVYRDASDLIRTGFFSTEENILKQPEADVSHRPPSVSGLENIPHTWSSLAAKISRILDGKRLLSNPNGRASSSNLECESPPPTRSGSALHFRLAPRDKTNFDSVQRPKELETYRMAQA